MPSRWKERHISYRIWLLTLCTPFWASSIQNPQLQFDGTFAERHHQGGWRGRGQDPWRAAAASSIRAST